MLSCPCVLTTQRLTRLFTLPCHTSFFSLLSFLPYKTGNQVLVPPLSFTDDKCQIKKQTKNAGCGEGTRH